MKVLIITASLNERSGWGRYSRAVVDQLRAQGCTVAVCAEDAMTDVIPLRPIRSVLSFVSNVRAVRTAAKSVDIVHALDGWPYGVYGYFAVLGTGKKLFINGVGTYSVAPLYQRGRGWLLRKAYAKAQNIFCISEYTRRELTRGRVAERKTLTVLQGATRLPDVSDEEKKAYAAKYGIRSQQPIILTVGALKERKGQFDTLKAVELLKQKYPAILYVALGSSGSDYADRMRTYAKEHAMADNLLIVSDADDRALSFFYAACDVFALDSTTDPVHHHFEGFGLVIVEAYQFGRPAVGSRDCGIEDAIEDGKTGLLAQQRDPEDIAKKIQAILAELGSFSENAKAAYSKFDWSRTVAAYIARYRADYR